MTNNDNFSSLWRASAYEAVEYTDDFPECFLVLPELVDGAIADGNATQITIKIDLKEHHGSLSVSDNGRGVSDRSRLLSWASEDSTSVHHRYGHGSKKCLTKWNKNYDAKWFVRYRTKDKRGTIGSLFTYNGPFEGDKRNKTKEDRDDETILMPSGLEWYIEFERSTLGPINTCKKIFNALKEILRTRYSKKYFDMTEFIIIVTENDTILSESSKEKKWITFQEYIENEVKNKNCTIIKKSIEEFNGVMMTFSKYEIIDDTNLEKEFKRYGHRNMKCSRVNISLNGRTIEHKPYHVCLDRANHNSFNGIIGFVDFEGNDILDLDKMPTPCTTKVSFYENCPIFKQFQEKFILMDMEKKVEIKPIIPDTNPVVLDPIPVVPKPVVPKPVVPKPVVPKPNPDLIPGQPVVPDFIPGKIMPKPDDTNPVIPGNPVPKRTSNKQLQRLVWDRYIGEDIATHKCLCCKKVTIRITEFICGHVEAESKGGKKTIENLRPICSGCNGSMGSKNMVDYVKECEFYIG
jgi:hypothetical protein